MATLYIGVALIAAAVVLFILQPVVKGIHASLEREDDELTETEARKRVALLALRDVEYDFLSGKLDEADYRSLKAELTAEALAALEADEEAKKGRALARPPTADATADPTDATTGPTDATRADPTDATTAGRAHATSAADEAGATDELEAEIARIRRELRSGRSCPACSYVNEEGSRFCSACGHALADAVAT